MMDVILKRFETPDETRLFDKGKFEIVQIGGMTIGRATYEPGWKWSEHVSPVVGTPFCEVEHSRWVDEAAFDNHVGQPHTVRFVEQVQPLVDHSLDTTRANLIE